MPGTPARRETALMAVATVAMGWPLLVYPIGLDEAFFGVAAARMWRGLTLYTQTWDSKTPGIFFMYMLPVGLGGLRVWPIMLFHLVLLFATALAILRLVSCAFGHGPAWTGALLYLMVACGWGRPSNIAQPDDWLLPFYLGGLGLLARAWLTPQGARRRAFVSGVFLGWAVNLRATMAPAAILLPLIWLVLGRGAAAESSGSLVSLEASDPAWAGPWRRAWRLGTAYIAGGGAIALLTLAYPVITGSLDGLLYAQFEWNTRYAQTSARWDKISALGLEHWFIKEWFFLFERWGLMHASLLLGAAGLAYRRWRGQPIPWRWIGVWAIGLAFGAVSLLAQLKLFDYHFWPVLPFLAMAAGLGLWPILRETVGRLWMRAETLRAAGKRWGLRTVAVAAGAGLLLVAQYTPSGYGVFRKRHKEAFNYVIGRDTREDFYGRFERLGIYRPAEDWQMAQEILKRAPKGHPPNLYIWGTRPQIYFLCKTIGPSRFLANFALRADWAPREWWDELRRELHARPPDFVVVGRGDYFLWITGNQGSSQDTMPDWLRAELDAHFRNVLTLKHCELWRRRRS